jgi:hypothetical protein
VTPLALALLSVGWAVLPTRYDARLLGWLVLATLTLVAVFGGWK